MLSASRQEYEGGYSKIQQQVVLLDHQSRMNNVVLHAPATCSRQQLMDQCNAVLWSAWAEWAHSGAVALISSALQSMWTHSRDCGLCKDNWHLQLQNRLAKHVMFRHSSSFRQHWIYMDDNLTKQPSNGCRSLADSPPPPPRPPPFGITAFFSF